MLSEQELRQICRSYEVSCPACAVDTSHFRLKPDMARPGKTEGDGHPLTWRWGKPGFDTVDPKQFFMATCPRCGFTGEIDDAGFRTCGKNPEYAADFDDAGFQLLRNGMSSGKGAAQSLLKRISAKDPMGSLIAQFHLGIFSLCLRRRIVAGNLGRYYLRIAWIYRDRDTFYPDCDVEAFTTRLQKAAGRWKRELLDHGDYPVTPGLVLDETAALRLSRPCFERNLETLREASLEDELRLRLLLAEIGFRLYEISDDGEDYTKAAAYYSGVMQQCLKIISDKSIVGGIVNRARGLLEDSSERGQQLRALRKSRGGAEADDTEEVANPRESARAKQRRLAGVTAAKGKKTAAGGAKTSSKGKSKKTSAPPKKVKKTAKAPATASGNGKDEKAGGSRQVNQVEHDKATRRIAVLTEELDTLKVRLQELEEDNKRWRQVIGRDALTGLPNKVALFRMHLPKVLKTFKESGPVSCIVIGLDQLSKVNEAHGWLMGDRMLKASAKGLRDLVRDGEELYRIDGANFVITGKMGQSAAKQRVTEVRRGLGSLDVTVDQTTMPLASSLGVVTVEQKVTDSSSDVANAVYEALLTTLYQAKDKGGNVAEVHRLTRF